ncbi:MAG: circadian clock protein KaiC [Myxococcales bacterium]|jgi:circadian clock protein KaiC
MVDGGELPKAPTGVVGLDDVTLGGLPAGRATLVCGGPGCGKTVLAMQFLAHGATEHRERGLFVSFEEPVEDLHDNFAPMGLNLPALVERGSLRLMHVALEPGRVSQSGEFSLDGLMLRLDQAISAVGARRVALDTLDSLFGHFDDADHLRAELARLMRWLKERGVTTVVTAERGGDSLTRGGIEEYVSDCVLVLDHRVRDGIAKRRLRVLKYRGSRHGADEYPFLIGSRGLSVFPITAPPMRQGVSSEVVSSGVADLDAMLGRGGYYRGSSVLVSGGAGTGKSTLAAAYSEAACARGERCLYVAFEESASEVVRNMASVGLNLSAPLDAGRLRITATRSTRFGLEEHLVSVLADVEEFEPDSVVLDPMSTLASVGRLDEVKSMLVRIFEQLKARGVTVLATSLTRAGVPISTTDQEVSSLMDTWIVLRYVFEGEHRRRYLHVAKSRGMRNSQAVRELLMDSQGLSLRPVTNAAGGVPDTAGGPE